MDQNVADLISSGITGIAESSNGVYYAYAPIEATNWRMCIRMPESVVLAPVEDMSDNIRNSILIFVSLFVGLLLILSLAASKLANRLTEPIISLVSDAQVISKGDLDHRAEIVSNDEIGDLAQGFNDMAVSLKKYIADLTSVTAEKERIGAELNVATKIQADMLPSIFPAFPERTDMDIYASMDPAKEVGGDFYDLFMVDQDHLGVVMADVSGKGVPAALFMVIAKTLIKNQMQSGLPVDQVFAAVNDQLAENNEENLFVTAWIAVIDLKTGDVEFSDAGHELPFVLHADGSVKTYSPAKKRPPLACLEGMQYSMDRMNLDIGDMLFLYTDGVPEATSSSDELYGMERLQAILEQHTNDAPDELLRAVRADVDAFVGDASQFDDLTMLAFVRKM
ncbi:MAG: SpoIIE family protein phosphatase [Lachnospiraceae bacterium]|nr:SpoIIE family protein phosphatase [Lachnospiraceae bacterium]